MVTRILPVQYHQQDTDYYCGASCAQMVLDSIGAGVLDQVGLYNDNNSHSTTEGGWATGPDGLNWTMNNRMPAAFANFFVLYEQGSEASISRKICWTIHHYRVAPIALVFGWAHWIAITGHDVSADPSNSTDTSYSMTAYFVHNPWPPTPTTAAEPPHSAGDGCGSGTNRGVPYEHIAYSTWQTDYMTGVPSGHWNGKFLAVCDPEPPAQIDGRVPPIEPGREVLSPERAMNAAVQGLQEYGLLDRDDWRDAFNVSTVGVPVLVERLDLPNRIYYIVPFRAAPNVAPLLVNVNAYTGQYLEAQLAPAGTSTHFGAAIDRDEVARRFEGQEIKLPDSDIVIRLERENLAENLVWRPCHQSLSPYWPFYMYVVGDFRIYIRIDGVLFFDLTTGRGI